MGSIFGGSKSKSTSSNQAYGTLSTAFSPLLGYAQQGAQGLAALLGGDTSGFEAYKRATGFDAAAETGSRGITGNAAASGLLRSGSTSKALQSYGTNLQNQYSQNYLDNLLSLANTGLQAGNVLSGAGATSTSTSKSKSGLGGLVGSIASGVAASDRRLKKNIFEVGKLKNGLKLYQFRYINNEGPFVGVMAQEVKELMPEALGPEVNGYMTVNYEVIKDGAL